MFSFKLCCDILFLLLDTFTMMNEHRVKEGIFLVTSTSSAQVTKSQKLPKSISVPFPVNGTKSSNRIVPGGTLLYLA